MLYSYKVTRTEVVTKQITYNCESPTHPKDIEDSEEHANNIVGIYKEQEIHGAVGFSEPRDIECDNRLTFSEWRDKYEEIIGKIESTDKGFVIPVKDSQEEHMRLIWQLSDYQVRFFNGHSFYLSPRRGA